MRIGRRWGRLGFSAVASTVIVVMWAGLASAASNNTIVTYAGTGQPGFSGDGGAATAAMLRLPSGIVLDRAANVFVVDTANNRVRKITAQGVITTVAGTGAPGFSGDGGPATRARLNQPTGLAVDRAGNLFIADTGNNRVRQVTRRGVITTIAGATDTRRGSVSSRTDNRSPEQACGGRRLDSDAMRQRDVSLCGPTGLAVDGGGNLFIADTGNNVVRELLANGTMVTFAGTGQSGFSGNAASARRARLNGPTGVAVSGSTVLIADTGNNQIRKVRGGTITAFAGTTRDGFSGDGRQATKAKLSGPVGVTFDPLGNVYVVDAGNRRVRQVTPSGVISTFAGTGRDGFSGDNGPAERANIRPLGGITTDATNVFFADTGNQRIRRIHKGGPPPALPEAPFSQNILLAGSAVAILAGGVLLVSRRNRHDLTSGTV